ncbi:hypothetical protein HWC35_gp018 [Vibrio phage USC-1]|uniref:Uncharacterized protein n=2 Tax=Aphroditevirus USC1 TaxID=2846605 RepID=A0A514A2G7_9CAUD|nr:hypothetical protein HWC35_gp018 [Vibrio phage USC-1]QCW23104.1 hypothetical protein [Vibrio phage 5 TSL-2019]QDH47412.1 hypothetical protein [Vibrio phage USC-1]
MQHIRQILLDKTALIRISYAESKGNPEDILLAKSRFEGLTDDEVTFKTIKETYAGSGAFIGEIKLTGRDGFEFTQRWSPGDTVPVLNQKERIKVPNMEVFENIVIPGLYYVEDIAELYLVVKDSMTIEEIQRLLGYKFEPGELEVRLSHLRVSSPVVTGTMPLRKVTPNPDGTMTDGTGIAVSDTSVDGNLLPANPHAPAQYITIERVGGEPVYSAEIDKAFKAEFVGSYRQGEVIEGTLGEDNTFDIDLGLSGEVTDDLQLLVSVGLDRDKLTDVYSVSYVDEHWDIDEYTVNVDKTRVGEPFRIAGSVSGDFGRTPWGDELLEPKIIIEEQGEGPVEIPFGTNGTFDVEHTPVVAGEMVVKFVCGLPQDLNMFSQTHQILAALSVDDLIIGPLSADKTEVGADELVTLTSSLLSSDDLTMTDVPVDFLVDDQVTTQLFASPEGVLEHIYDVENDTSDPVTYAVKLRLGEEESNVITITVQPSEQIPGRFEIINDEGELFKPAELRFKIYDTVERPMVGTSGTWYRENGAPKAYVVDGDEYVATLDSPVDAENTVVESITLKCQSLVKPIDFTWNLVRRFDEVVLDPSNPTEGVTDQPITLSGKTVDQTDTVVANVPLVFKNNGVKVSDITSDEQGVFNVDITETDESEHLYSFAGENDIGASIAVTWAKNHILTAIQMASPTTVDLFTDTTLKVEGTVVDQYDDPMQGETVTLEYPDGHTETQTTTESGFSFDAVYRDNGELSQTINVKAGSLTTPITVNWTVKSEPVINNLAVVPTTVEPGEDYTVTGQIEVNYTKDWSTTHVTITNDAGETNDVLCNADGTFAYVGTAVAEGDYELIADAVEVDTLAVTVNLTVFETRVPTTFEMDTADKVENVDQNITITGTLKDQKGGVMEGVTVELKDGDTLLDSQATLANGSFSFTHTESNPGAKVYTVVTGSVTQDLNVTWKDPNLVTAINQVAPVDNDVVADQEITVKVELLNSDGNPVVSKEPTFTYTGAATPTQNGNTFTITEDSETNATLTVSADGVDLPITLTWAAPPAVYSTIEVVSGETTGTTGETVPVKIVTKDQNGDPMPNQAVTWNTGGAPFPVSFTDGNGELTFSFSSEDEGAVTYNFSGGGGVTGTSHTITWSDPAPVYTGIDVQHGNLNVAAGETVTFTITTVDQNGQPMDQEQVVMYDGNMTWPARTSDLEGVVVYEFTETEAKSMIYAFLGGDDRKEYTVTWS